MTTVETTLLDQIREVTDEEVRTFHENGWVLLRGLFPAELAAAVLARSKAIFGESGHDAKKKIAAGGAGEFKGALMEHYWIDYERLSHDDELVYGITFSPTVGKNAQRLIGRKVAVRYDHDKVAAKPPKMRATAWHQDFPIYSKDRKGELVFWIALDEVTAEMGGMRYLTGAHLEGPMGRTEAGLGRADRSLDMLQLFPDLLDKYDISPPQHLQPGDAVVHTGLIPHGTAANQTERPRWSMMLNMFPDDTLYTGADYFRSNNLGLKVNRRFDVEVDGSQMFPIIYPESERNVPPFEKLGEQRVPGRPQKPLS